MDSIWGRGWRAEEEAKQSTLMPLPQRGIFIYLELSMPSPAEAGTGQDGSGYKLTPIEENHRGKF